jgi:lipopolysaccharide/colanic/teichoic acid biosynthesis glycosyltransferase
MSSEIKHREPASSQSTSQKQVGVLETLQLAKYHDWKRVWELPLAVVMAAPVLLVTLLLVALVRLTSKGPGIYAQQRMGKGGKLFRIYKLRSMYEDAELRTGPMWCEGERDPRITPLGWWLRKLHLDELPQILNVIRGDMSICGPRPERPEIIVKLVQEIPYYDSRLLVRPGITGLAQINLKPDQTTRCVHKKQALDLEYIETASLILDLRMIVCTAIRVLGIPGKLATSITGLEVSPSSTRFSLIYDCDDEKPAEVAAESVEEEDVETPEEINSQAMGMADSVS